MMFMAQPVYIRFWDHAMNSGEDAALCKCEVLGFLYKKDRRAYYVASWIADQTLDANTEQFSILRKAVIQITYLEPRKGRTNERKRRTSKASRRAKRAD